MKPVTRLITAAAALALAALGLTPTAQAAGLTFDVWDDQVYEYDKDCSVQGPPYPCWTAPTTLYIEIHASEPVRRHATLGYQIEPITATPGTDYTGTTGTLVMAANTRTVVLAIPVIMDQVAEPTEALQVRLTSSSIGGDIRDTGRGSIFNDGEIPPDCNLSRPSLMVTGLECTGRPATQRWQFQILCNDGDGWVWVIAYGEIVTGNGSSVAECDYVDEVYGSPYFVVRS